MNCRVSIIYDGIHRMTRSMGLRVLVLIVVMCVVPRSGVLGAEYPDWEGFPPINSVNGLVAFQGALYGATDGGLFRYDPQSGDYHLYYKNNGLISNAIRSIAASPRYIYLGFTEDGLWRFDPSDGKMMQILFPEYHIKTPAYPTGIAVKSIYAPNDSIIYIGHDAGLDRLDLINEELRTFSRFGAFAPETAVNDVDVHDGTLWVCTPIGLATANVNEPNLEFAEKWATFTYAVSQKAIAELTSVLHVEDVYEKTTYLGTVANGILYFNTERGALEPASTSDSWIGKTVNAMAHFQGRNWAALDNGLFVKTVKTWMRKAETATPLLCLAPTDDMVWIGTRGEGMTTYDGTVYTAVPPYNDLRTTLFSDLALSRDGVLWCAAAQGDGRALSVFQRFDGASWTSYDAGFGDWTRAVNAVHVGAEDRVWTAVWGSYASGIYAVVDDGTPVMDTDIAVPLDSLKTVIKPTIADHYLVCRDIAEDASGNLWVANYQEDPPVHAIESVPTSGAVVIEVADDFTIKRHRSYSPAQDGLPTAMVKRVCPDPDGWVWLGTLLDGVTGVYYGADPFAEAPAEVHVLGTSEGMHDLNINTIARDKDGSIWVGSAGGLNRIQKKPGRSLTVEDMNPSLGEADRDVNVILVDSANTKWIGTNGGLIRLNAANAIQSVYTAENSGLFSSSVMSLAFDEKRGHLWVGTTLGLNLFKVGTGSSGGLGQVRVYPNPFEIWGYNAVLTFPGLKDRSALSIYTFTGELVTELTAEDGVATWNGKNPEGATVGSGIYFFRGIDAAGRVFRDKFAVVRR